MDTETRRELDRVWHTLDASAKNGSSLATLTVKVDGIIKWLERQDRNRRWNIVQTATIFAAILTDIATHFFK